MCRMVVATACGASMAGCSVLSISGAPLWELAKAAGGAAVQALEQQAAPPVHVLRHEALDLTQLCIVFNPQTPTGDFVPALQKVLLRHGVGSRVYEAGTPRSLCPVWLQYRAEVDWGTRTLSQGDTAFLAQAELTLRNAGGRVLATGLYRHDPTRLRDGKWVSTQDKLDPLVAALVARP
jgi:hypothetical protein